MNEVDTGMARHQDASQKIREELAKKQLEEASQAKAVAPDSTGTATEASGQ